MVGPYPSFRTNYQPDLLKCTMAKKWTAVKVSLDINFGRAWHPSNLAQVPYNFPQEKDLPATARMPPFLPTMSCIGVLSLHVFECVRLTASSMPPLTSGKKAFSAWSGCLPLHMSMRQWLDAVNGAHSPPIHLPGVTDKIHWHTCRWAWQQGCSAALAMRRPPRG